MDGKKYWISFHGKKYGFVKTTIGDIDDLLNAAFDKLVVKDNSTVVSGFLITSDGAPVDNDVSIDSMSPTSNLALIEAEGFDDDVKLSAQIVKNLIGSRGPLYEIIEQRAVDIPFAPNRESTLNALKEILISEAYFADRGRTDKTVHEIPVLSTLSGFGKTRTLLQLKHVVNEFKTDDRVWRHVYLTYNQGFSETDWEVASGSVVSIFAWRLLFFYFTPRLAWGEFVSSLKRSDGEVVAMDLHKAISIITTDIRCRDSIMEGITIVLVLCIDEYQLISEFDAACFRLISIIKALSAIMCSNTGDSIIIPVFAGLYLLPLQAAAKPFSINLKYITMAPFGYDDAADLVRSYSGKENLLLDPEVRRIVFQLTSVPAHLVAVLRKYESNSSWQKSFSEVCDRTTYTRVSIETDKLIYSLIACSISRLPVSPEICSTEVLDNCGYCWFVNRDESTVCVPFMLFRKLSYLATSNVKEEDGGVNFLECLKECVALLCRDSLNPIFMNWQALEFLGSAQTAMKINAYGMIRPRADRHTTLSYLLDGAFICDGAGDIGMSFKPIAVRHRDFVLDGSYVFAGKHGWENGDCLVLGCERQPVIDAYAIFKGCKHPATNRVFDLFYFDQCKLRANGGLVPKVYKDAVPWCRQVVARYKSFFPDREAGFIFGVRDPLKTLSTQTKNCIQALSNEADLEFFYGLGRVECIAHYDHLSGHPALVPRIYINERTLTAPMLAIALSPSWTYPRERAELILGKRPDSGYVSWDQLMFNARMPDDQDPLELPFDQSVIRFR